jgi:hypothetical protein
VRRATGTLGRTRARPRLLSPSEPQRTRRRLTSIPADSVVLRASELHHRGPLDLLYPFLASAELLVARSTGAAGHQGRRRPPMRLCDVCPEVEDKVDLHMTP